jgi:hypothetical protein
MKNKTQLTAACTLLLGSVLFRPAIAEVQANLLQNPSFEAVQDGTTDQAANWFRWGQWLNREDSWSPTHEGKCVIGYHHWQIESADDSGMWQDVAAEPGKQYEFTIYANRDDAGDKKLADTVEIRLEAVYDDHTVAINSLTAKVADIATGQDWSKLTVKGTAANAKLRVLIRIAPDKNGPRGGAVKFDDARLTK